MSANQVQSRCDDISTSHNPPTHSGSVIGGILKGMMPLFVAIPAFMYGLWGTGILVVVGASFVAVGSRLPRHKPVSGLDLSSLALGVLLAIGYFRFGNIFFIEHFGLVIYSALLIQVLYGELRGEPFTAQYSKQIISSDRWATRGFFETNRFLSRFWGLIFVVSILMVVFGTSPLMLMILPNALVVLALVFGPNIGYWYSNRFAPKVAE